MGIEFVRKYDGPGDQPTRIEKLVERVCSEGYEAAMGLLFEWVKTGVVSRSDFTPYVEIVIGTKKVLDDKRSVSKDINVKDD
jgi:hypothetical protein